MTNSSHHHIQVIITKPIHLSHPTPLSQGKGFLKGKALSIHLNLLDTISLLLSNSHFHPFQRKVVLLQPTIWPVES